MQIVCLVVLLCGALLMAAPAIGSVPYIISNLVVDDAFYYLLPAHNLTHGLGLTFDGIHTTNGFQPLWMLVLMPLAAAFGDRELLMRATLAFQTLLYATSVWILVRAALRSGRKAMTLLIVIAWMVFGLRHDLGTSLVTNGLESALYFLMLTLTFVLTVKAVQTGDDRTFLLLSATVGLAVLTRMDAAVVVAPMYLFATWRYVKGQGIRRALPRLSLAWSAGAAPVLLYMAWSMAAVGIPTPVSGQIKLWHAQQQALAQYGGMLTLPFLEETLRVFFRSGTLIIALVAGAFLPLQTSNITRIRWFINAGEWPVSRLVLIAAALLGCLLLLLAAYRRYAKRVSPWSAGLLFLGLGSVLHLALHSFAMGPVAYYNMWHYVGEFFFLLLLAAWVCDGLLRFVRKYSQAAGVIILGLVLLPILWGQQSVIDQNRASLSNIYTLPANERAGLYRAALWTEQLPATARAGAFNAGVAGFVSRLRVTNLDGLINSPVIYRQMQRNIPPQVYVAQEGIEVIIDYAPGGLWPLGELGRFTYLDEYADGSAAFVMDTCLLWRQACFEREGVGSSWLLAVHRRDGRSEWWIGTAWDEEGYQPALWRVVSATGQPLAGPFEVADTWPPGMPQPWRDPRAVFDYRRLPEAAYGRQVTVQHTGPDGEWVGGAQVDVPDKLWVFGP